MENNLADPGEVKIFISEGSLHLSDEEYSNTDYLARLRFAPAGFQNQTSSIGRGLGAGAGCGLWETWCSVL